MTRRIERSLRQTMSTWQFWTGVSYFVLALVCLALVLQNGRIASAQRRADQAATIRIAEVRASASSQYAQCVRSIPTLRRINGFLLGVRELHEVIIENNLETHRVTPPGRLYAVQERNLARLRDSLSRVSSVRLPVPTKTSCADVRDAVLAQLGLGG